MERRFTFNEVAALYDSARPSYPEPLFDDVIAETGLSAGEHVLEVGSGTGKATLSFARRGFPILAIEPGAHMIATARDVLAPYRNIRFVESTFEAWEPDGATFGLVASAQAWHWVDPAVAFAKAARVLRPNGVLAIFGNVPLRLPASLFDSIQKIQLRHFPDVPFSVPGATVAYLPGGPLGALFEASGLFGAIVHKAYPWRWPQTTKSHVDNLRTASDFRIMEHGLREALLSDISAAIDAFGGKFEIEVEAHLYTAHLRAS